MSSREVLRQFWSGGDCSILFVNPGYFNHEKPDKQWIMWLWTFMRTIYRWIFRFLELQSPPWQNCVIPSLCLFAPPTPQILKQPKGKKRKHLKTTKALILVCYSDGEILQVDTELDIYFIFDASKCRRKLQICYTVGLLCVLLLWQTQQSLPQPKVCKMPPS